MTFNFELSGKLKEILTKLIKKDKQLSINLNKKIKRIINSNNISITHFKNLKKPLNHLKRVHVGSFVLTFQLKNNYIIFEDFTHHDNAY